MDRTGYIMTLSGRLMQPMNARAEDIKIDDIANALSLRCRFNCQIPQFYSVAQHCVLGATTLKKSKTSSEYSDPEFARAWLLHDAAEAYLPDVPKPLKPTIPGFQEMEDRLQAVINDRFRVKPYDQSRLAVLDARMLETEIRDIQTNWPKDRKRTAECFPWKVVPFKSCDMRKAFMEEFRILFPEEFPVVDVVNQTEGFPVEMGPGMMQRKVSLESVARDEPKRFVEILELAGYPLAEWRDRMKGKRNLSRLKKIAVLLFGLSSQSDELRLECTGVAGSMVLHSVRIPRTYMS